MAQDVTYEIASWPVNGRGNHRAMVYVDTDADAVKVHIPWRRHDFDYLQKGIRVYDETTGVHVVNAVVLNKTPGGGDVIFQPQTVPGTYAVYFMPWKAAEVAWPGWLGSYYPAGSIADPTWLEHNYIHLDRMPGDYFCQWHRVNQVPSPDFVMNTLKSGGVSIGRDFMMSDSDCGFVDNHYRMTFDLRFDSDNDAMCKIFMQAKDPSFDTSTSPTAVALEDSYFSTSDTTSTRYYVQLTIKKGHAGLSVLRENGLVVDAADQSTDIDWNAVGKVNMTIGAMPDNTYVKATYETRTFEGQPIVLKAAYTDESPNRQRILFAPRVQLESGTLESPSMWAENIQIIRQRDGEVIVDGKNPHKGLPVDLNSFPDAKLLGMQSSSDRDAFYPMEVIATEREAARLLNKYPSSDVLFFPEDRLNQIKMIHFIPRKWYESGPSDVFTCQARPGEYYVFQVGVWAARKAVDNLTMEFSDIVSGNDTRISAESMTCFNLTGVDAEGVPFVKEFTVDKGSIRPLWIGVDIPSDASGEYTGSLLITCNGGMRKEVSLQINVCGSVIPFNGDEEPWRMSRLRWLNSNVGTDLHNVPPPYTPIELQTSTLKVINRQIHLSSAGLPDRITSNDRDILAAPVEFVVHTNNESVSFVHSSSQVIEQNPSSIRQQHQLKSTDYDMTINSQADFDGVVSYDVVIQSRRNSLVDNIELKIAYHKDIAEFMAGLGVKGGYRPQRLSWKWPKEKPMPAQNVMWLGGVDAGLAIKLLPMRNNFEGAEITPSLYEEWINNGNGGVDVDQTADTVNVRAYTGAVSLNENEDYHLRFRLYVTPFKPMSSTMWKQHLGGIGEKATTFWHLHHDMPAHPYINYPYLTMDKIAALQRRAIDEGLDGISVYYGSLELSTYCAELFGFKSLGDEIIDARNYFRKPGQHGYVPKSMVNLPGCAWQQEHLVYDYTPHWHSEGRDNAVMISYQNSGNWRYYNYFLGGVDYLKQHAGNIGIYNDGIFYNRQTLRRLIRILCRDNDRSYIFPLHAGYTPTTSTAMIFIDHLSLVQTIMFGEGFSFDESPDYMLIEESGLPFGLINQWHANPNPARPYHYMLYAGAPCTEGVYIREFYNQWHIQDSSMKGWWDKECPVRTDNDDILATAYIIPGQKTLICVASWLDSTQGISLDVDYTSLGLDPDNVKYVVPNITCLQNPTQLSTLNNIRIDGRRGIVISVEKSDNSR